MLEPIEHQPKFKLMEEGAARDQFKKMVKFLNKAHFRDMAEAQSKVQARSLRGNEMQISEYDQLLE